jgi:tetratricopeptide (TPR) repeat protein
MFLIILSRMKNYLSLYIILLLISPLSVFAQDAEVTSDEKARAVEYFIQGINDFENEDYERALDNLTAAHLSLSEDPGINYALSDVYLAMGDYSNAAYYGELAATADPENKWYHLQLADIYRKSGRTESAMEAFDNALQHHPNDVDVLFMKANTYVEFGELLKANELFDRIIEIRGPEFELHLRKFQNFNALQMRDSALVELEVMRKINPSNLSTLHTISQYYLELGDEASARETLLDARDRNPRDPQTLILLAEIFINNREWQALGDTFISMIEDPLISPSQKMELVSFIYLQHQRNPGEPVLTEQAESAIRIFSESEPEYGPAQLVAADFFLQQNELEPALETLIRVNELIPDETEAWSQRMQILFSLQRYREVIELSEEADEKAPNNALIQFFTGASYMLENDPEQAELWLKQATEAPARRNFRSIIYGSLGDVKTDLDKWDEAVEAYETALRLDSNNHNVMNNYAYFLSVRGERLDYAQQLAEGAITLEPDNAAYLDTMGWIHYKLGNYEDARQYIRMSVDTGEASAEVYEHLGDVYQALENEEEARIWWEQALEKDPERGYLRDRLR